MLHALARIADAGLYDLSLDAGGICDGLYEANLASPDEPGAAARVFQQIAAAHINVRYSYLATRNRLVIASDDPQAVINAVSA